MATKTKTREVAKKKNTDVSALFDGGATGLENVTSSDVKLPIITILQDLSPQVKKTKPEFIEGAEVGEICNPAVGDTFEEITFLPCAYKMNILEWLPNRNGLVTSHGSDRSILSRCEPDPQTGKPTLKNGNIIMEHAEWYILNLTANKTGRRELMSLTWSQMNPSRKLMTAITNEQLELPSGETVQAPLWFRTWKATTAPKTAKNGKDISMIWVFSPGKPVLEYDKTGDLLQAAKNFHKVVMSGEVTGDHQDEPITDEDSF